MSFPGPAYVPAAIGVDLREARQRRGFSLDQVARATKISVTILRAIEADRFDDLPQSVFLRGFLRAYAREVGLDPEAIVSRYLRELQQGHDEVAEASREKTNDVGREATRKATLAANGGTTGATWTQLLTIGGVVFVIGVVSMRWGGQTDRAAEFAAGTPDLVQAPASPVVSSPESSADRSLPATGTAGANDAGAVAADGEPLRIDLRPGAPCWVEATVDGRRVVYRLMSPGEQHAIEVHDEAVFRIGDAAAFAFSIDGALGRPLGRSGQPVTVRITKENYRTFLALVP